MSEKLIIKIVPSSPGGKLDVEDAMQQVIDSLALLRSAATSPTRVQWHLDSASTNSPFNVVAEAYSDKLGDDVMRPAKTAKANLAAGFRSLARGRAPQWMDKPARQTARRFLQRNTRGIGMTSFDTGAKRAPVLEITPRIAAAAIRTLEKIDLTTEPDIPAHTAFGEVEGRLESVGTLRSHHAIWIRNRVYGTIPCTVPDAELRRIGGKTTLEEVWKNQRVVVGGRLRFGSGGKLEEVVADRLEKMDKTPIGVEQILDREFTGHLEPSEYLRRLQDGELD